MQKRAPVIDSDSNPAETSRQDDLYLEVASSYGAAIGRLARAYENDPESSRDLLQEIHIALWRSLPRFDGRCSLRTWVYRVAHNIATSHVIRDRRAKSQVLVSLDELDAVSDATDPEEAADRHKAFERLMALIQKLNPLDRQIILLYLEGMDGANIGEITGISAGNTATKIHRIKNLLVRRFHQGELQ